jgi:hypothetical protein
MFNPDFNPLRDLEQMAQNQEVMSKSIMELARAFNHQNEEIQRLSNRIQLLEMTRQYEQENPKH